MTISVITDIDINEDQKARLLRMVRGNGCFDYEGNYRSPKGSHTLKSIHFVQHEKEIPGGESLIDGLDDLRFQSPPYIYLEDMDGNIHGWTNVQELKTSQWHYGIIFQDDQDDLWFFGRDQADGSRITLDCPILRRVRATPSEDVLAENGPLIEALPAQGEFWLSDEDPAVVTSIPWWTAFAGPDNERSSFEGEREILTTVKARVQIMISDQNPNPSDLF